MDITITEFLNREYKDFAIYNNKRMIPSIIDGFKPVQRKIIYSLTKRPNALIKVTQLAGYVIAETDYIHGESSLHQAIITMAKPHKNFYPLLVPDGQFGTRLEDSAAAARYLYTKLNKDIFFKIFRPEDNIILKTSEDGEPEYYYPIIPLVLLQDQTGLGVGFKSSITPYSPSSVINWILSYLEGKKLPTLEKAYPFYKGKIEKLDTNKFKYYSVIETKGSDIIIKDLPIDYSLLKIRELLLSMKENGLIKSFEDNSSENEYYIIVRNLKDQSILNLSSTITDSLTFFDTKGKLHIYSSPEEILEEFVEFRLEKYKERLSALINEKKSILESKKERLQIIYLILQDPKAIQKIESPLLEKISLKELKDTSGLEKEIKNLEKEISDLKKKNPKEVYIEELKEVPVLFN